MKKILTFAAFMMAASLLAHAQDTQSAAAAAARALSEAPKQEEEIVKPQYWTRSVDFDLGFNQTGLWSWAAGGYHTISLAAGIDAKASYAKDLMKWNNRLQLNYGFLWSADKTDLLQKSTDRIYLESKWAYKTGSVSKWNYTASFDFRSQFTNSYDDYKNVDADGHTVPWYGTLKSGFMAPAYTNIALGLEWSPNDWFNINLAPLTGGFTICTTESLRKSYGMKLREEGLDPNAGDSYHSALFQFGAQLKANAKFVFNDVFTYDTQLVLFTDYLDQPFAHNRVNWDNKISWQAAKYFKIAVNTWMIYDPIVTIDGRTSKVQFKEFFSISFTYKLTNKK